MRLCIVFYQLLLCFVPGGYTDEDELSGHENRNKAENQAVENENHFHMEFSSSSMLAFVPARSCHIQFSSDFGIFSPPTFNVDIDVNFWCNWTVLASPGKHIVVYITGFGTTTDCNENHDEIIFEGVSSSVENSIVYACWNKQTHVFAAQALAVNIVLLWRSFPHSDSNKLFKGKYYIFEDPNFKQGAHPWNSSYTTTALPEKLKTDESHLDPSVLPKYSINTIFNNILTDDLSGVHDERKQYKTPLKTIKVDEILALVTNENYLHEGVSSSIVDSFLPTCTTCKGLYHITSHSYDAVEPKQHPDTWTTEFLEPSPVAKWQTMTQSIWISEMASSQLLPETPNLNIAFNTDLSKKLDFDIPHVEKPTESPAYITTDVLELHENIYSTAHITELPQGPHFNIVQPVALSDSEVTAHFSVAKYVEGSDMSHPIITPFVEPLHPNLALSAEFPSMLVSGVEYPTDLPEFLHISRAPYVELPERTHPSRATYIEPSEIPHLHEGPYSELPEMPHPSGDPYVKHPDILQHSEVPYVEFPQVPHPSRSQSAELSQMLHHSVTPYVEHPDKPFPIRTPYVELPEMPQPTRTYSVVVPVMPRYSVDPIVELSQVPHPSRALFVELPQKLHYSVTPYVELPEKPHTSETPYVTLREMPDPTRAFSVEIPHHTREPYVELSQMPHSSSTPYVELSEMPYLSGDPYTELLEMLHPSEATHAELLKMPPNIVSIAVNPLEIPQFSVSHPVEFSDMPHSSAELSIWANARVVPSLVLPKTLHHNLAPPFELTDVTLSTIAPIIELPIIPHISDHIDFTEILHISPVDSSDPPGISYYNLVKDSLLSLPGEALVASYGTTFPNTVLKNDKIGNDPYQQEKPTPFQNPTSMVVRDKDTHASLTVSTMVISDQQTLPEHPSNIASELPTEMTHLESAFQITENINTSIKIQNISPKATETALLKTRYKLTESSTIEIPTGKWQPSMYLDDSSTTVISAVKESMYAPHSNSYVDIYQKEPGQPKSDFSDEELFHGNKTSLGLPHVPGDILYAITIEVEQKNIILKELEKDLVESLSEKITDRIIYFPNGVSSLMLKEIRWINVNRAILNFWIHLKEGGKEMGNFLKTQLKALASHPLGSFNATLLSFSVEDVNECQLGIQDCSNMAECVNVIGTYSCHCLSGYEDHSPAAPGTVCIASRSAEIYSTSEHLGIVIGCVAGVATTLLLLVAILCIVKHKKHAKANFNLQDRTTTLHSLPVNSPLTTCRRESGPTQSDPTRRLSLQHTEDHYFARGSSVELTIEQTVC